MAGTAVVVNFLPGALGLGRHQVARAFRDMIGGPVGGFVVGESGGGPANAALYLDGELVDRIQVDEAVRIPVESGFHTVTVRYEGDIPYRSRLEFRVAEQEEARFFCKLYWAPPTPFIRLWRNQHGSNIAEPRTLQLIDAAAIDDAGSSQQTLSVVESTVSEEPVGIEQTTIENPSRGTNLTTTYRATREWSKSWQIEDEQTLKGTGKADVKAFGIASIEASIEAALTRNYAITESNREEFLQEVVLQVPPQSKILLTLRWKRIWQHGRVRVTTATASHDVPYRIVRAVTFDQSVEDA